SRRRPLSSWRFFVTPLGWLAVAMLALVTAPDVPSTDDVAVPVPWQWALVLVAIAATAAIVNRFGSRPVAACAPARLRPGPAGARPHPSDYAAVLSALPRLVVVAGAAVAASAAEPWTMILAFAVVTVWAQLRRIPAPAFWPARIPRVVLAALAPLGVGVGIAR